MVAWQSWSPSDCRPIALRPYFSIGLPIILFLSILVYFCIFLCHYIIFPYIRQVFPKRLSFYSIPIFNYRLPNILPAGSTINRLTNSMLLVIFPPYYYRERHLITSNITDHQMPSLMPTPSFHTQPSIVHSCSSIKLSWISINCLVGTPPSKAESKLK